MPAAMPANALSAVGVQGHGVAGRLRGMGHASPAVSLAREDACGDGRLGGRAIASLTVPALRHAVANIWPRVAGVLYAPFPLLRNRVYCTRPPQAARAQVSSPPSLLHRRPGDCANRQSVPGNGVQLINQAVSKCTSPTRRVVDACGEVWMATS